MTDNQSQGPEITLAALLAALTRQAEATVFALERFESRVLPLLERMAIALEGASIGVVTGRHPSVAEFRLALREHRWEVADQIARDLLRDQPADPEILSLAEESESIRSEVMNGLRDRIEAARLANDADGVLSLHGELSRAARPGSLKDFDSGLAKWLMATIHRRLRGGTIRADLTELASKVAEQFSTTPEGASLKASLPTLRRSAGLCPRCGDPYPGLAEACPKCLGASFEEPPEIELPPAPAAVDEPFEPEIHRDPFDLNNAQHWQDP